MSNTEKSTFIIDVDGRPGARGLDEVRGKANSLGGGVEKLKGGFDKFDGAMRETQKVMGGLGAVMGGTKGKAVELLGTAADLGGAFAAGGGLYLGIMATTFVITKMAEAYAESQANARVFADALPAIATAITNMRTAALEPGKKALEDLSNQLRDFGKDSRQIAIDSAQFALEAQERANETLTRNRYKALQRLDAAKYRGEGDVETAQAIVDSINQRLESGKVNAEGLRAQVDGITRKALELDALEDARDKKTKSIANAAKDQQKSYEMAAWAADRLLEKEIALGNLAQKPTNLISKTMTAARDANRARLGISDGADFNDGKTGTATSLSLAGNAVDDQTAKWQRLGEAIALAKMQVKDFSKSMMTDLASGAFTALVGSMSNFFSMLAAHEEHAFEKSAAMFLSSVGQQIIGLGTRAVIEGMIINATPGTFGAGLPLMGIGAAAIAVGMGMSAGGAALSASIAPRATAPTTATSGTMSDPTQRRRDGLDNGVGQVVFQFNYGIGGPNPQDTAAAVATSYQRATARGFGTTTNTAVRTTRGR
jgi:hypothetical protein